MIEPAEQDREQRDRGIDVDPPVQFPGLIVDLVVPHQVVDAERDDAKQPHGYGSAPLATQPATAGRFRWAVA